MDLAKTDRTRAIRFLQVKWGQFNAVVTQWDAEQWKTRRFSSEQAALKWKHAFCRLIGSMLGSGLKERRNARMSSKSADSFDRWIIIVD